MVYCNKFDVKVWVHQGSVLSPILYVIVFEAVSQDFRAVYHDKCYYADDLVIMAETTEELSIKPENWKSGMEANGLRVNTKKTKVMISHPDAGPVNTSGKYPCGVCSKGVVRNSI
jgi:hypothetical protein